MTHTQGYRAVSIIERHIQYMTADQIEALKERFWSKVLKTETCWLWTAAELYGYGLFGIGGRDGRPYRAHRIAWELASGEPIPDGLHGLHTCDNRACVRNDDVGIYVVNGVALPRRGHLFLGTNKDNSDDMRAKGRAQVRTPDHARGERNGTHTHPESVRRGELNGLAKLTTEIVLEIRRRYVTGELSTTQIPTIYGIKKSQAWNIVSGRSWRHLGPIEVYQHDRTN